MKWKNTLRKASAITVSVLLIFLLQSITIVPFTLTSDNAQQRMEAFAKSSGTKYSLSSLTFGSNVRVNHDSGAATQSWPCIATDTLGTLHVLWVDNRTGDYDVYYSRSTDRGATWTVEIKVNDDGLTGVHSFDPACAMDPNGNLHAVWMDRRYGNWDIFYSLLISGETDWSTNVKVSDDATSTSQVRPAIAVTQNGIIHVVWQDARNGNYDIHYSTSIDSGEHWSSSIRVNDDGGMSDQRNPRIAVDRTNNVYLVWSDERNGNVDVYAAKRESATGVWSSNTRVNDDVGTKDQYMPDVAVDPSGNAHVVWFDYRSGESDIYYSKLPSGTLVWSTNIIVNDLVLANKQTARVATDIGGNVHAVWWDMRNGHYDIYYAKLSTGSTAWSGHIRINDDKGRAEQRMPALATDVHGLVYVVWEDNREGDYDLFFAAQSIRSFLPLISRGN